MLLGEWLKENEGFTDGIVSPDSEIPSELIEYLLNTEYSKRIVHDPMQDLAGVEVANFINMRYNKKWIRVYEYYTENSDIGVVNSKEINENFDGTMSGEQSGEFTNKESAFNTENFVNSDGQDNSLSNTSTKENSRNRTEKYRSYFTGNQQMMNLNNESMLNVIVKDIVNELCLKIY